MADFISNIANLITENFFAKWTAVIQNFLLSIFEKIMSLINNNLWKIWDEPLISNILNAATMLSFLSMIIGIVFLFNDIAEQIEQIDLKIILFSLAKAFIFVVSSRWLAFTLFYSANFIIEGINYKIDASSLHAFLNSISSGGAATILLLLALIIALAVFFIMQLNRFAALFIHVISAFAYVPYIVCGDTQKIKEWASIALSISLSYAVQYVSFYSGVVLTLSGSYLAGMVLIIASFIAAKELKNLGHSTGTANSLRGSAGMAYQAVIGMKSLGVV